jgi:hypothetical protein
MGNAEAVRLDGQVIDVQDIIHVDAVSIPEGAL